MLFFYVVVFNPVFVRLISAAKLQLFFDIQAFSSKKVGI